MPLSDGDKATIENCFKEKGWGGRRIVKEFPGKGWNHVTVNRLIAKIRATGSVARKTGSGRPKTVCTEENKDRVEELIQSQEENPGSHKSLREVASDLEVSKSSVQRMAKSRDLQPFKRIHVSRRDQKVRGKRKTRCRNLNDRYSVADVKKIIFTDEKDFTLEIAKNRQNDRVYGKRKRDIHPSRLYHESSRFSKKIMVSAGVSWKGKTNIHFIDTDRVKVNSENYMKLLDDNLLPDCRRLYPGNDYVFQQDGAPSHTSRVTQAYLEDATPEFIKKDEWPPQSPDCNPMDYAIWDSLKEKVYEGRRDKFTEQALKDSILASWERISLEEIRKSISAWKKRLRCVVEEDGGHIEHKLK